jgi:hypothetical protein
VLSAVHDRPHADTDSIIGVVREDLGFAEVIHWGRCPECVAATSSAAPDG